MTTKPNDAPAPVCELTSEEMVESLTGYEEIAIAKAFGSEVFDLAEHRPMTFLRACVFAHERRTGKNDADAKKAAMDLSIKATQEYFTEEPDEVMPDEPASAVGKDDEPPA